MNIEPEFFFQSQPRLQLIFDSPNHCATILGMVAILLTAVATWIWKAATLPARRLWLILTLLAAAVTLWALSSTYSRGGWASYLAGWACYTTLLRTYPIKRERTSRQHPRDSAIFQWATRKCSREATGAKRSKGAKARRFPKICLIFASWRLCVSRFFRHPLSADKRISSIALGIFFCVLILLPHGPQRVGSVINIEEDRSIAHRFIVWKGAMTMTAEHWLSGVGDHQFGRQFTAWYQPLGMKTSYHAALNNYLTLAAEKGIFALWGYLALISLPLALAGWRARRTQNVIMLGVLSAQIVYLVSGLFTFSLRFWHVTGLFAMLQLVSLGYLLWALWHEASVRKRCKRLLVYPIFGSTALVCLILAVGLWLLRQQPTRRESVSTHNQHHELQGVVVRPRQNSAKGQILYFHDKGEDVLETAKTVLRPLAEMGYKVVSFDYRAGGMDGLRDAKAVTRWALMKNPTQKISLVGLGVGGRMAILAACDSDISQRIRAVASINAEPEWPFPELSPKDHLDRLQSPLLVLQGDQAITPSVEQARILERVCKAHGKVVQFRLIEGMPQYPDEKWSILLSSIDDFVKPSL